MNVYFHPEYARREYFTAPHEWKHVSIIFDAVKYNKIVPGAKKQHSIIDANKVPLIK